MLLLEQPRNTAEEARALQQLAGARRWRSVLLVTSATHLPRALATFRRLAGVTVIPVAEGMATPRMMFMAPISVLRGMVRLFFVLMLIEVASLAFKYI